MESQVVSHVLVLEEHVLVSPIAGGWRCLKDKVSNMNIFCIRVSSSQDMIQSSSNSKSSQLVSEVFSVVFREQGVNFVTWLESQFPREVGFRNLISIFRKVGIIRESNSLNIRSSSSEFVSKSSKSGSLSCTNVVSEVVVEEIPVVLSIHRVHCYKVS